jgi:hypothetical protein
VSRHYSEDDLTLYYYGEGRYRATDPAGGARSRVAAHLESCAECAKTYRDIAGTLALIAAADVPARGDQYGLEVWQRIRHRLPERSRPWWVEWFRRDRLAFVAATAALVVAAFVAGRVSERQPASGQLPPATPPTAGSGTAGDVQRRILLTSVADHLDRSERVLTDLMNVSDPRDISTEQAWADDLLTTSRLYRQDAVDAGEQSVASVLDELERSLLEIVHSPSKINAADLEQIRRRIDAAALLFKVRVMSDELRQRENAPPTRTVTGKTS